MRQTQNGFGKKKWEPGQHQGAGGLEPEDSGEDEGVDDDEDSDEEGLQQEEEDDDEKSDHNFWLWLKPDI